MSEDWILFDTVADAGSAAKVHADGCAMLNKAGKGRYRKVRATQETVDNLLSRGFKVTRCKCTKR